ncbi:energy-converting hydrogenase B subunit EhbP [Methanothermococcus sp. SCGC AD-155-C09]|nr:energy-converting hydrogenase B subunit EhbP [Methanothermococcus sp. SCGC AD-155-C09]
MPKMVLLPKLTMALGGYIRETVVPYSNDEVEAFPYRNVIVGNPTDEPIKIDVPAYDKEWVERHRELGLIVVPVSVEDDFVGLFNMVREKVNRSYDMRNKH